MSPVGWAVGMWPDVRAANVLWLVATVLMSAWTLWLGAAVMRRPAAAAREERSAAAAMA